jgi:iron(III) transport system substrate-binding protein
MSPAARADSAPAPSFRARLTRPFTLAGLIALVGLLIGCDFGGPTATPTAVLTPTPAARPTAEPPAAVSAWYVAAQAEEPVRIRADLTAGEIESLTRALARRYPEIEVEWRRGSDVSLVQETLAEARTETAGWDVYVGDSAHALKTARLALRWTPPEARGLPADLIDAEGAWYGLAATYHVLQFNSEQVPPQSIPQSYEALQHPGYFGRLAIEDQNLTWLKGLIETRGREGAGALVRALAQQAVTFRTDARAVVVFVTAGDQAVAIDARMDVVERERRSGGKTNWVAFDPVVAHPLGMAVAAATDRPNGARLVANYLLSQDAQSILAQAGRAPGRTDVDPEPQNLTRGIKPRIVLPPEGQAERDLRELWQTLWGRR